MLYPIMLQDINHDMQLISCINHDVNMNHIL